MDAVSIERKLRLSAAGDLKVSTRLSPIPDLSNDSVLDDE